MIRMVIDYGIPEDRKYHITVFPLHDDAAPEMDALVEGFLKETRGLLVIDMTLELCLKGVDVPDGTEVEWHYWHLGEKRIKPFPEGFLPSDGLIERLLDPRAPGGTKYLRYEEAGDGQRA